MSTASYFISKNELIPLKYESNGLQVINLKQGYNKISFEIPLKVKKGSILYMKYIKDARLAVDSSDDINYSDYMLTGMNELGTKLAKIDNNKDSRFLINTLVDVGYYKQVKKLDHVYPFMYSYTMSAVLSNSSVMFKAGIKFSEGNFCCFYKINCHCLNLFYFTFIIISRFQLFYGIFSIRELHLYTRQDRNKYVF